MRGKLTTEALRNRVFKHLKLRRHEVLVRPKIGEDCAVVDVGNKALVITTDPITGTTDDLGKLIVNINLNDIASNGCEPLGMMLTVLAPETATIDQVEQVIADAASEAEKFNVEIIGGHTEWTSAVNQIVVSAVAFGLQEKTKVIDNANIKEGDVILMTKTAGLEGTAIIAQMRESELIGQFDEAFVEEAQSLVDQISVVNEGLIASRFNVHAMHDVTEGGLLGAIWELCSGVDLGFIIEKDDVPIDYTTAKICEYYNIDPLRLISSGTLLIILEESESQKLMSALYESNIEVQKIGKVTRAKKRIQVGRELIDVPEPNGDALFEIPDEQ